MNNDRVQTLNYCAHALDELRLDLAAWQDTMPLSAQVLARLIDMLESSVKFILPNCCNLVDPDDLKQAHFDLARLPFPCVAFEAPWDGDRHVEQLAGFRQSPATKRIALCWEARPEYDLVRGFQHVRNAYPAGGFFVEPIYWAAEFRKWIPGIGGMFLPQDNTFRERTSDELLPASRLAQAALIEAGLARPDSKQGSGEAFYLFPELFEQVRAACGGTDKAVEQIILNSRDETFMAVQACSVINCANVTSAEISAPAALNKKRQAKGRQPFFSYKVLQLSDERREPRKGAGGTHARPRMHLRRGHLRRLESKVVWVRPSMVNAGSPAGVVSKDYSIPPRTPPS